MKLDCTSLISLRSLAMVAAVGVSVACGVENKAPPRAAEPPKAPPRAAQAEVVKEPPAPPNIVVSKDIREACSLAEPKAYFAYNSSKLRQQDQDFLRDLARCFSAGALQKREMLLVGHTDPRGGDAYNYALGQQRADTVRTALLSHGLEPSLVAASSRGKRDAVGRDAASWARDRRVEAKLGR